MRERRERDRLTVSETTGAVRESSQQTETGSVVKTFVASVPNKAVCRLCSLKFRVVKHRCLPFSRGPGQFRELWEARRNHFHLSSYLSDSMVPNHGQKPS